jgi:hypothetical protein
MERTTSSFQEAIETIERLPPDDQALLIEIIRQRLIDQRRAELAAEITEARAAYQRGEVHRGSVADLMKESPMCNCTPRRMKTDHGRDARATFSREVDE